MPPISTQLPYQAPSKDDPQSVIHAPSDYKNFENVNGSQKSPTEGSENTIVSPPSPEQPTSPQEKVGVLA